MRGSYLIYIILLLFLLSPLQETVARKPKVPLSDKPELPDSIFRNVTFFAPFYEKIVEEYNGQVYMKGTMNVKKSNRLIRVVPSMFKLEKNVKKYIIESMSDIHYTAPDIYDLKVKALTGTILRNKGISKNIQKFFKMNVYSSSLLSDKLYSPLASNGQSYYYYYLDSIIHNRDDIEYKVLIYPRNKSSQLVTGYMVITEGLWTVREMYIEGEIDFVKFKINTKMGKEGNEEFLTKQVDADVYFNFVGNKIYGDFSAFFKYDDVKLSNSKSLSKYDKNKYDLTEYFKLTLDSTTVFSDSTYFAKIRPFPLDDQENDIYQSFSLRRDTAHQQIKIKNSTQIFWGQVEDVLLTNNTLDMAELGTIKLSPILNPLMLSYSPSNGYSYRQVFKYNRTLKSDRWLQIVPRLGYNFTRKEFYWSMNGIFDYWPKKRASFNLSVGGGNRIYSSDVLDDIKNVPDSIFDFDDLDLNYFKDLYFIANHDIEVMNGFKVSAGVIVHRRTPVKKIEIPNMENQPEKVKETITEMPSAYVSFAPRIRLEFTPGMYYYMNRTRKINLYSNLPTFSLDWEKGIKGVFGSTGKYERLEFDMQHYIRLGLMRNFYYRVGMGGFIDQEQMYFVDFVNFSRRNLPVGWNDDIGGVFQLLDGRWYNSSDRYLRGHFTYESPFLFWPHLIKYTSLIESERLYLSVLFVPHLTPYIELGYGIGTHIFDFGVFVNNINGKFSSIGCKFSFELFK